MNREEHLDKIIAKCNEIIALGEKRTPAGMISARLTKSLPLHQLRLLIRLQFDKSSSMCSVTPTCSTN